MSWVNFLYEQVELNPRKEAIIDQSSQRRLTYEELLSETLTWVDELKYLDIKLGDRVAYINTNSLEHITIFLACAHLGAIFIPINWRLGENEQYEILKTIKPKTVLRANNKPRNTIAKLYKDYLSNEIIETQNFNSLKKLNSRVDNVSYFKNDSDELILFNAQNNLKYISENICSYKNISMSSPLLMLFTSGSTGTPKGVMFHGEMLKANQENTISAWGLKESDKCLVETPFFHTGGYNVLLLPLLSLGGTAILAQKFEAENFYKTLKEEKITVHFGVPTMFQCLQESNHFKNADFASLRFLISGGAPCPKELIEIYQSKKLTFKQGFGLTEVGPNCFQLSEEFAISKIGSIGKPMTNSEVKLVDVKTNSDIKTPNVVGELVIKGSHLCAGYYKNQELFNNNLVDGYFRTGDLARFDSDGFYYIVGRKKEMYISGGENVYPAEVVSKLNDHPLITDSVVVAVPDTKWHEVGYAFYRAPESLELEDVREYLNPLLSRYKHPQYLKRISEFPLLDNGKVDNQSLKAMALENL